MKRLPAVVIAERLSGWSAELVTEDVAIARDLCETLRDARPTDISRVALYGKGRVMKHYRIDTPMAVARDAISAKAVPTPRDDWSIDKDKVAKKPRIIRRGK